MISNIYTLKYILLKKLRKISLTSELMSVNPAVPKEMSHSTSELRFLKLEAGLKKQEELAKNVEKLTKRIN